MKNKFGALFLILIFSLFMGITGISIGFGAVFPSLNRVAGPFVCPQGEMQLETQTYNPYPGSTITTLTWYCADPTAGTRAELGIFPMSLYAGVIYGFGLFAAIMLGKYIFQLWEAAPKSPWMEKLAKWVGTGALTLFIGGILLIGFMPLLSPSDSSSTSNAIKATATAASDSIAATFEALSSGAPSAFDSTEKPLATWNNIPIMPEATAGEGDQTHYSFRAPTDTGTITKYYTDTLKSSGWIIVESNILGMEFTKNESVLLVTLAPASDLRSFIVTLTLIS